MSRSKKKIGYVHKSLFKKSLKNFAVKKELRKYTYNLLLNQKVKVSPPFMFWKRDTFINKRLIGHKIAVYNGFYFLPSSITKNYLGFKLKQLTVSSRTPKHKGKQRQKKKVIRHNLDKEALYRKKKGW